MWKAGRYVLVFLLATFLLMIPIGVLGSSNLVWGEPNQYGRVAVPGMAVLHLSAGTVDVHAASTIVGRGNETPNFPLPDDLALAVVPVEGSADPAIEDALGDSSNAIADGADTDRLVWKVHVPEAGDYRVRARGSFTGAFLNPQLWFGHGPPIPGTLVPAIAAVLALVGIVLWVAVRPRLRRRRAATLAVT